MTTHRTEFPIFTIDPAYICNLKVETTVHVTDDLRNPVTGGIEIEQGTVGKIVGSEPHPEFKELRKRLLDDGLIKAGSFGSINGDRVVNPFLLNRTLFLPGVRFSGPVALSANLAKRELDPLRDYYPELLSHRQRQLANDALDFYAQYIMHGPHSDLFMH